jgi:hypothetical protein
VGPVPPPAAPRNYSKLGLKELMNARVKYPENAERINKAIRDLFEKALRELKYESGSRRARKIGEILRILPRNFSGRRNATSLVINNVRNTRNERELQNLATNLGRVPNEDIARAFSEQKKRLKRKANNGRVDGNRRRVVAGQSWAEEALDSAAAPASVVGLVASEAGLEEAPVVSAAFRAEETTSTRFVAVGPSSLDRKDPRLPRCPRRSRTPSTTQVASRRPSTRSRPFPEVHRRLPRRQRPSTRRAATSRRLSTSRVRARRPSTPSRNWVERIMP